MTAKTISLLDPQCLQIAKEGLMEGAGIGAGGIFSLLVHRSLDGALES